MIALRAFAGVSDRTFSGIVEADETFQKESRKGSREWVRHLQDPANHPEPPRLRWYEYGKRGIPMLRGLSRWQLPILTVADRAGARWFERIPDCEHHTIHRALSPLLVPDAVLCTDGHPAYKAFTRSRRMEHFVIRTKPGQKTPSRSHHIQNINSLHSRFKGFLGPFRGPASKYLPGYIDWFIARIAGLDPSAAIRPAK